MTFEEIRNKVSKYTVGIAGCGGLGSNCAAMLVRSGVTKLVIADFDVIQESNLNRQFFFYDQIEKPKADTLKKNLLMIDPHAQIESHVIRLDREKIEQLFASCDVIVEAFDLAEYKQMLIETVLDRFPEKPLVCASGLGGLENADQMRVVRNGNLIVVGDFKESVSEENPPMAPKVTIAAALQANEVLLILCAKLETSHDC
ncbi:MAG: thiamine biosynthesis protein ThiF [Bacteroidetes bacterium GWF2_43_63]|nr:MAG: thiamine biosynthesis protein ThiF [Bacteroidetes bacterium GWE2_42_42]OFY52414.1 MAG: thiamine biosynthesis protein ThiF [Bacteroidetes bacterium GWF2_43_63]HBG71646.1 sulfur carrier protein ThiS adenylyltransferase ThiF [Bacteroidales bacterium]HCB61164.1 sulfur carrier protein ThiS adenylyltransferase ThiF [Bacteroidales bacterium]HCY23387.1 sulfur carrier protein ThiS adenylyltransferase ThiF [Bacteroidales bacterium]